MITLAILIPALIYLFIIYMSMPHDSINTSKSTKYLVLGLFSPVLVILLHTLLPRLGSYYFVYPEPFYDDYGNVGFMPTLLGSFVMNFCQVGFVEELCKFVVFYLIYKISDKQNTHPLQTFFNVILVSTGFALLENMVYYYRQPFLDVIFVRTFTSLVLHMVCGVVMGYFIARSQLTYKSESNSNFSVWLTNNPKYKERLFIIFGIISSTILHGSYDYDLEMKLGYSPLIIVSSLFGAYYLFKNLRKRI